MSNTMHVDIFVERQFLKYEYEVLDLNKVYPSW